MRTPNSLPHDVRVWNIQDRTARPNAARPWIVRWRVDGTEHSRAYPTRPEADHVRSLLVLAARTGERFDPATGRPASWLPASTERRLHQWVREWLADQWPEWQPRTRVQIVEGLTRFIPHVRRRSAPAPPDELRRYLVTALIPGTEIDPEHPCEQWLDRYSPYLHALTREMLAVAERKMSLGVTGHRLRAATIRRYRRNARSPILRAVDLGILERDPWPPAPRGSQARKANRIPNTIDCRRLPDPATMARVIAAVATPHPATRTYQVMTAVAYYGALRPSEVVVLNTRHLALPTSGWGRIDVVEADDGTGTASQPKTGHRSVPIPPVLVTILRGWIKHRQLRRGDPMFRTRAGKLPDLSTWRTNLHRATATAGAPRMRVYDCRHAAATTWLRAGVPLAIAALRLGHSVETLVATYVGAIHSDDATANALIEAAIAGQPAEGQS